ASRAAGKTNRFADDIHARRQAIHRAGGEPRGRERRRRADRLRSAVESEPTSNRKRRAVISPRRRSRTSDILRRDNMIGTTGLIRAVLALAGASTLASMTAAHAQTDGQDLRLTESACTSPELAAAIPTDRIGESVSAVVLDSLTWVAASGTTPA